MENSYLTDIIVNYTINGIHFTNKFTIYEDDTDRILKNIVILLDQYHCEELQIYQTISNLIKDNKIDTERSIKEVLITNIDAINDQFMTLKLTNL